MFTCGIGKHPYGTAETGMFCGQFPGDTPEHSALAPHCVKCCPELNDAALAEYDKAVAR